MRGRNNNNNHSHSHNHRKSHNPMARVYESNGPEVKIRGNPAHIAEKYMQLARDAQTSGDPIAAENYYQHAEHYYRLIAAAQEQFRQANPHLARPDNEMPGGARDDAYEDGDDDGMQPMQGGNDQAFGTREPQPYMPRDAQPFPPRDQQQQYNQNQPQQPQQQPRPQQGGAPVDGGDVDRLPSFITGGQPQQPAQGQPSNGQNGHDNQGDRFPLHRRRRRHRGPRQDAPGGDGGGESPPRE